MPTATDNRPDEDQDRIQQHYNNEFSALTSAEHQAKSGIPGDLSDGERGGSIRDEEGGSIAGSQESTKGRRVRHDDPVNPENGFYNEGSTRNKRSRFSISRRKGVTGGIIGLLLGGGVFLGGGIATGPLQVIHLGEVLHHAFSKSESDSANRTRHMLGYARAAKSGNIGETRIGVLGSKVFGKTINQLHEIGIDIETGRAGQPTKTAINTDKLKENYPELDGMHDSEKKAFLADKLGVDVGVVKGSGASFSIDQSDMNIRSSRLLSNNSVGLLDDGKIASAIKTRTLTRVFDLPSLFHPWGKLKASVTKKFFNGKTTTETEEQQAADEEAADTKTIAEAAAGDGAETSVKNLKGKFSSFGLTANGALTFTGIACSLRGAEQDIVLIDRARVVLPAAVVATRVMAKGSQVKYGSMSLAQVGALVKTFTDKKGKTIWQSKPLNVLAGGSGAGLSDIDSGQRQAFGSHNTVNKINSITSDAGANPITCSTPGQIAQGAVTIGIAAFEEVGSFGAATPAVIGEFAAKQGIQLIAVAGVMHFVEPYIKDAEGELAVDALSKYAFTGLSGGGLYAYGARASANTTAISTGGVALSNNESTLFAAEQAKQDRQEFRSESMFARIFDVSDYRSLTGRLADSISPSMGQNLTGLASSLTHMASSLRGIISLFTPHATALAQPYDWGFPQYGIPQKLLYDPNLSDPYKNADLVAEQFDQGGCKDPTTGDVNSDCRLAKKIKACFGTNLSIVADTDTGNRVWDVIVPTDEKGGVDPESSDYPSDCNDFGDENWNRVIMFVFDTNTMKAAACYQGEDEACKDLSTNQSDTGSSGGSQGTLSGGVAWPVAESYWKNNKDWFLKPHTMGSSTFTSPSVAGLASDLPVSRGTPVYSMVRLKRLDFAPELVA